MVALAEVGGGPRRVHRCLVLAGDPDAARIGDLGPEESEPVVEEAPDVQPAVQVELVEVDTLGHRLRPVRLPDLHAQVSPSRELRIGQLGGEILVEGDGGRLAHPHEDDAHALFRGIRPGPELADER